MIQLLDFMKYYKNFVIFSILSLCYLKSHRKNLAHRILCLNIWINNETAFIKCAVTVFQELRAELEDGFENGKFRWEDVRPNDAAGLLKQFLRELPVPLLTLDYLEAFAQVESKETRSAQSISFE